MYPLSNSSIAIALKPYAQRILFAALLCLACMLIYAERANKQWLNHTRAAVLELASPLAQLIESPARAVESIGTSWTHFWHTHSHNQQLRMENTRLLQWQSTALRLQAENDSLRQLLQYQPSLQARYVTAHSIGASVNSLSQQLHISAGQKDGLRRHLPVINEHGLVGRLLHVSPNRSQVLLLTDMRSRIPVQLQPSGERAILMGNHHGLPTLKFANKDANPTLGETVFSADDGNVLPAGLFVGKLFAVRDGQFEVRPAYQSSAIDMLRIIDRPIGRTGR